MSKTKKGFLIAGGVLAIIGAVFTLFAGFSLFGVNQGSIEQALIESGEPMTPSEREAIASFAIAILKGVGWVVIALAVVNFVLGVLILVKTNKGKVGKGLIISELIFSLFGCGMMVTAFMIVALCLKDKPKTDTNIETIQV